MAGVSPLFAEHAMALLSATPIRPVDPEFLAWARANQRDKRRKAALMAQLRDHPDPFGSGDVRGQAQAWARRHGQASRLQASAMAHLRHA